MIGTFGAVIRIKSPIRSRKALFDIGIAGPIAGFLVAVPVLFWGLALSKPMPPDGSRLCCSILAIRSSSISSIA